MDEEPKINWLMSPMPDGAEVFNPDTGKYEYDPYYYIWQKDREYESGKVLWYAGIFYEYLPEDGKKSTKGVTPLAATGQYTARGYNAQKGKVEELKKTERTWMMIDPRSYPADKLHPKVDYPERSPCASFTQAALRGLQVLSRQNTQSIPNYFGDIGGFTGPYTRESYGYYLVHDGLSHDYGVADPIWGDWTTESGGVVTKHHEIVGNLSPQQKYIYPRAAININGARFIDYVLFPSYHGGFGASPSAPGGYLFENNGADDAAKAMDIHLQKDLHDVYHNGIHVPEHEEPYKFTRTCNLGWDLNFSPTDPITVVWVQSMVGRQVSYKTFFYYYEMQKIDVPAPYIGYPDVKKYVRSGGTLVLKSGNGTTTPRVYDWKTPFNGWKTIPGEAGTLDAPSAIDAPPTTKDVKYDYEGDFIVPIGMYGVFTGISPDVP